MRVSPHYNLLFIILAASSWQGVASAGYANANERQEESTESDSAMMPSLVRRRGLQERTLPSFLDFLTFPVCESVGGVPTNDRVFFLSFIFYFIFRRDSLGACPEPMLPPAPTPPASTWVFGAEGESCSAACGTLGCTTSVVAGSVFGGPAFVSALGALGLDPADCTNGIGPFDNDAAPAIIGDGACRFPQEETECDSSIAGGRRLCCCGDATTMNCPLP